jgi:hypothetical protein
MTDTSFSRRKNELIPVFLWAGSWAKAHRRRILPLDDAELVE